MKKYMRIEYKIPFYGNTKDNTHCFQACLKMVLKYFLPNRSFTWKELEEITAKVKNLWTWPFAGLSWMSKNGFEVIDIESFDTRRFIKEGENYLKQKYGQEVAKEQIKYSDIKQERILAKEFLKNVRFEKKIPQTNEIKQLLKKGYILICNVNSKALDRKKGYVGHFVVINGFNKNTFILQDSGIPPRKNRIVNLSLFEKAWAYPNEKSRNIMAFNLKRNRF